VQRAPARVLEDVEARRQLDRRRDREANPRQSLGVKHDLDHGPSLADAIAAVERFSSG
jgi:hypothetical protein